MATLLKNRPDLRIQKSKTEMAARQWVEKQGGVFLTVNWAKGKCHYLTATGKKAFLQVAFELHERV